MTLNEHVTELSLEEEGYDTTNVISFQAAYRLRTDRWIDTHRAKRQDTLQRAVDAYLYGDNDDGFESDDWFDVSVIKVFGTEELIN
jgi:hypothetical protein